MANLNALIAQGVQFKAPPDPFDQYAKMQQLTQGQQANQLNQMKMQEYQRGVEEQNQLRQLDPSAPDYLAQVSRVNPKLGFEFGKLQQEAATAKLTQQKTQIESAKAKQAMIAQAARDISSNPSDAQLTAYLEDIMRSDLFTEAEKAQVAARHQQLLALPYEQRSPTLAATGATAGELKPHITPQNLGGSVQIMSTPAFGGAASVVPGSSQATTITPGQDRANQIAEARLSLAEGRAAAGPKAPDLKQVPVHAQKAIVGAATTIEKLDNVIAAMEAKTGGDATGLKGYLPNVVLNRAYPEGTDARAAVADIGSLVLHDRSGAAVTAAETPRLMPFIPQITDTKEVALKKLKRMRQIQVDEAEALAGTYTPEQGFREFKTPTKPGDAPVGAGLSPEEQAELDQLRKRFKK